MPPVRKPTGLDALFSGFSTTMRKLSGTTKAKAKTARNTVKAKAKTARNVVKSKAKTARNTVRARMQKKCCACS